MKPASEGAWMISIPLNSSGTFPFQPGPNRIYFCALVPVNDLRVLDYDGHHIMLTFSFKELGQPFTYE